MYSTKVSVIMSVYKEPLDWIHESIDSIRNQTFKNFELLIVNDNPEDDKLKGAIDGLMDLDKRIRVIHNKKNIGLTRSLNKALALANGEYIARMDADDISLPVRFEYQVAYMDQHPLCGVCGCNVNVFGSKQFTIKYPNDPSDFKLYFENPFAHPTVMIRKSVLDNNKICYNESLRFSQDYDLWVQLFSLTEFANLDKILLNYRISDQQITSTRRQQQYDICTRIRARALNEYCQKQGIHFKISNAIGIKTIRDYHSVSKSFAVEDRYRLLFYLYRSVNVERYKTLLFFLMSGDVFKVSTQDAIKTISALTFKHNAPHFYQV